MFDSCFLFPIVFKICKCTSQLFIETKRRSEIKQLHKTLPGVAAACSTCTLPHRPPDCVPRNQVIILVLQTIHRRFHDRFSQSAGLAVYHSVLNVKAVVAAFNQEKAFSMITNLRVNLQALAGADHSAPEQCNTHHSIHTPHTTGHCSPLYTINISLSILEPSSNHGQRCLADYSMFYRTALEVISIVFVGLLGEL